MLIPITTENNSVRRPPFITFGIMVICALAFVPTWIFPGDSYSEAEDKFGEAVEYFFERPYLDMPPDMREMVFGNMDEDEAQAYLEVFDVTAGDDRPSSDIISDEQAILDGMIETAMAGVGSHPLNTWGLTPSKRSPLTFITHMFLHAGWLHLLGNMLFLYLSGPFVEDRYGRPLYAALYGVGGVFAASAFMMNNLESTVPMVGASGAIAAVMGAFVVRFWNTKIKFFYWFGLVFRGTFWAPAWLMLGLWLAEQVFMGMMMEGLGSEGGVAYWAHVGGFVFGMAAAFGIKHFSVEEQYIDSAIEQKTQTTVVDNSFIGEAFDLHQAGKSAEGFKLLDQHLRQNPRNVDALMAMWTIACDVGQPAHALPAMLRVLEEEMKAKNDDLVRDNWRDLFAKISEFHAEPRLLVGVADSLINMECGAEAAAPLTLALRQPANKLTPAMLLRIARTARTVDQQLALHAVDMALARPDLMPQDRTLAESLRSEVQGVPINLG